ncbi:MAG: GerMN domain-containing protein [Treponema sp.]|nr:GerMN domain-containing protein [Treponema sp.]
MILRSKVSRRLPVSDTPMSDVLRVLVEGPNQDEASRGILSLIPAGTQFLSASVKDGTAFINFSDDFMYNTYGVEGYLGQLNQIIYTATEFPGVTDVQILIDGRPVDFLGVGIWIGSPIRRGQF